VAEAFTREVVELWAQCRNMAETSDPQRWEGEGGCRSAYRDAKMRLHALLGLAPHEWHPLDARAEAPPAWLEQLQQAWRLQHYRRAHRLAVLLEEAAGERGRARPRSPPARRRDAAE
jgi:hypothetical protein